MMTALFIRLAILIAIFASVFLLAQLLLGSALDRNAEAGAINRRLRMLRQGFEREDVSTRLLKNAPPVLADNAGFSRRTYVSVIRMIMMSGLRIKASILLATAIGISVGAFAIITILALNSKIAFTMGLIQLAAILAIAIGIGVPLAVVSRLAQRRRKRMEEQFPNGLDVFIRSLRAGHPVASAIDLITQEMEDPIGSEFGLVSDEIAYGADLTDALGGMAERWDSEDMRMFVVCISVQNETGGNLAEILTNLAGVIRDRSNMFLKVRALSSEGRVTAWMLSVLPVFTFVALFLFNPSFYLDVSQDPIFVVGFPSLIVLYVVGILMIRKMVDLKV